MRFAALASLVAPAFVAAASNFAGSNLYYAAGINATARTTLLKYVSTTRFVSFVSETDACFLAGACRART